jgi:menaquinone-dependent protoporphyrinogen IX oxidase
MKGAIIYNSKYGSTRQYAEWLAKELGLPLLTPGAMTTQEIDSANYLLIGTPVYYGRLQIKNWLRRNVKHLSSKKLFFFIVCGTSPEEKGKLDKIATDNIPVPLLTDGTVHFLPGRVIHQQLTFWHKLMMKLVAQSVKDPLKRQALRSDLDGVKKERIEPLLREVNDFRFGRSDVFIEQTGRAIPI